MARAFSTKIVVKKFFFFYEVAKLNFCQQQHVSIQTTENLNTN
jgi:hypothetical protein